jgi:hypothetical protein
VIQVVNEVDEKEETVAALGCEDQPEKKSTPTGWRLLLKTAAILKKIKF